MEDHEQLLKYAKEYYNTHRENYQDYYTKHRDKMLARSKQYNKEHHDKFIAYQKRYYIKLKQRRRELKFLNQDATSHMSDYSLTVKFDDIQLVSEIKPIAIINLSSLTTSNIKVQEEAIINVQLKPVIVFD